MRRPGRRLPVDGVIGVHPGEIFHIAGRARGPAQRRPSRRGRERAQPGGGTGAAETNAAAVSLYRHRRARAVVISPRYRGIARYQLSLAEPV